MWEQLLTAIGFDLTSPIFIENLLCKVYRGKWGPLLSLDWIPKEQEATKAFGWLDMHARGWHAIPSPANPSPAT